MSHVTVRWWRGGRGSGAGDPTREPPRRAKLHSLPTFHPPRTIISPHESPGISVWFWSDSIACRCNLTLDNLVQHRNLFSGHYRCFGARCRPGKQFTDTSPGSDTAALGRRCAGFSSFPRNLLGGTPFISILAFVDGRDLGVPARHIPSPERAFLGH